MAIALAVIVPHRRRSPRERASSPTGTAAGTEKGIARLAEYQRPAVTGRDRGAGRHGAFAWMDDAALMEPGSVWVGFSMIRWQGGGAGETSLPVFDGAFGVSPRMQLGVNTSRVAGGDPVTGGSALGTTFLSAKMAAIRDDARGFRVALAPTLEVLSASAMLAAPINQNRVQWGLPVSVEFDHRANRAYGSAGYFSPGVWFSGAGFGTAVGKRVAVFATFSHAWATPTPLDPTIAAPSRSDSSSGLSIALTPPCRSRDRWSHQCDDS